MKITNKHNLPEAFVKLAQQEEQIDNDQIRVTQLLNGLRATELLRRYGSEIEVDVSEMIWMIFGTATHAVLENTDEADDEFREQRLSMPLEGISITGKSDVFKDGVITDYKTCSVWKVIHNDFEDWERQLMLYALLWKYAGFDVKSCRIVAMMRDHSKNKARTEKDYPDLPVETIEFPVTEEKLKETYSWAKHRVQEMLDIRFLPDEKLPMCTPEERFNDGDRYAIMKNGAKRAKKVCDTREEAEKCMAENGGDYIEVRKGRDTKCLDYCMARSVCPYAQSLKGE